MAMLNLSSHRASPCGATGLRRSRILIVEGPSHINRGLGEALAVFLRMHDYDARPVYSCNEAVALARLFQPDVAIIELRLDDMLGTALADRLKKEHPKLALLLWGGAKAWVDERNLKGKCKHVFLVLQKPLHPPALLAELERLLNRRTRGYKA